MTHSCWWWTDGRALDKSCCGSFVWADTVVKFVEQGISDKRLNSILPDQFQDDDDRLDGLYHQVRCTWATRKDLCWLWWFHTSGLLSPLSNNFKLRWSILLQPKCCLRDVSHAPYNLYYLLVVCRTSSHHMSALITTVCVVLSNWNRLALVIVQNFFLFFCNLCSLT